MRVVEDYSKVAARLLGEVLVDADLGGQADDRAANVRLLAQLYRLVYVAGVTRRQASHYYHNLKIERSIDDGMKRTK